MQSSVSTPKNIQSKRSRSLFKRLDNTQEWPEFAVPNGQVPIESFFRYPLGQISGYCTEYIFEFYVVPSYHISLSFRYRKSLHGRYIFYDTPTQVYN